MAPLREPSRDVREPAGVRHAYIIALALSTSACAAEHAEDPDAWSFPDWGTKEDQLGSALTVTRDPSAQVFDGYNHVVDASIRRTCVLPEDGGLEFADFRAGGDLIATELKYLTTRKQLEQALDIDAQAKLALGALGGNAQLGIHSSFKSSERVVSILLRSRHVYTVINQQTHALTDAALATLQADPAQFARECGTDYIAGVAHGAELVMLIQIESSTLDKKLQVESKLAASGIKAGPASLDASLGAKFASALADESLHVSVSVQSRGFVPSVDLAVLSKLDGDAFGVAATAQKELRASVELDKCHDQGESGPGTCGGVKARGYLGNGARVAVPMGILRQQFQRTANFPSTPALVDALLQAARAADTANSVLEDYAEIYDAMVAIHADEVGALVSSERPFDFGIYDTTSAMREDFTYDEWIAHATTWAEAFDPANGEVVEQLADALQPCWTRAEFMDFSECAVKPAGSAAGQAVLATLADYAEARVRPVSYSATHAVRFDDAVGSCPTGWRMPNKAEANRLWFAIERNPEVAPPSAAEEQLATDRGTWFDDSNQVCPSSQGAWLERMPDGTFATGCYTPGGFLSSDMRLPVACVPKTGIWGTNVPKIPAG
jgi:hypothetical protein